MAQRNLVLCSDGTGNRAGKAKGTNVWKLYEALERHAPDGTVQLAIHDDGVGTSKYKPVAALGGAFGYGLARNVRELYLWLAKQYRPGDRIFMFGFSRGAFTVRCLAGLVARCGVLDPERVAEQHPGQSPAKALEGRVMDAWVAYRAARHEFGEQAAEIKARYGAPTETDGEDRDVHVAFVGVWDTVDAYGLPVDELVDALHLASAPLAKLGVRLSRSRAATRLGRRVGRRLLLLTPTSFRNNRLSPLVDRAAHAVAIDDERKTFHPELWDLREEERPERIEQVWFAGMHSDVGGGYPRGSLALVSLSWMLDRAGAAGLRFVAERRKSLAAEANALGPMHDSRSGVGVYYRYEPRDVRALCGKFEVPVQVHGSVLERIDSTRADGAPSVLPDAFEVVDGDEPCRVPDLRPRGDYRAVMVAVAARRRRVYRGFVLTTVFAVALPFVLPAVLGDAVADAPEPRWGALGHAFALLERWLPAFAADGLTQLRRTPLLALLIVLALYLLDRARARLLDYEDDAVRRMWRYGRAESGSEAPPNAVPGFEPGRDALRFAGLALLVGAGSAGLQTLARDALPADRFEPLERPVHHPLLDGRTRSWTVPADAADFVLDEYLVAGETYRVGVRVAEELFDAGLAATPDGLVPPVPFRMSLFAPLRRELREPWFRLLGAVGSVHGRAFPLADGATITPDEDGRLHVFVNDAVCYVCPDPWVFYGNNRGSVTLTLTHARRPASGRAP